MSTDADQKSYGHDREELDVMAVFYQIMAYKWLILIITAITLSIGVFYSSTKALQYQANILLQVESKEHSLGQGGGVMQLFGGSPGVNIASTQMALIRSRFILEPVIQELGLDTHVSKKTTLKSFFYRPTNQKLIRVISFKIPRELINKPLKLFFDKIDHFILYNKNKILLQGVVGSLASDLNKKIHLKIAKVNVPIGSEFILQKSSDSMEVLSLQNRLKIQESGDHQRQSTGILEVSLVGSDPEQVVNILNALAKTAQTKDAQKRSEEASQTLDFLYKQLPITKNDLEKAETLLNKYRAKSGKIDIKLQATFVLDQLKELDKKLTTLRIHKIDMLQKYTQLHPIILAINTQSQALEIEKQQLERQLKTLPASDQIAVNLLREVGVKKTLYLILLNKIQELQVLKAGTVSSVHILSLATLPDYSLPTKRSITYLISILIGLVVSFATIFLRTLINHSVDDPTWSERHYNIANLAIIPFCKEQHEYKQTNKNSKIIPLLAYSNSKNLAIESLRSLRTSLQVTLGNASNNVVCILGVTPGVGKSFVSANLAYLLSVAGKRVVLIDGDLRRGTVHKYFNSHAAPGIAEVLNESKTLEQVLVRSLNDNMTFLPRGAYPKNPSELLMSEKFKFLIQKLSDQYDIVIIDTPPVLLVTDAVLIAGVSATNYLVLGAATHQPTDIEMVLKRLSTSGVQVHGTIFNFYRSSTYKGSYGQYGKYSKYNTYYYDESVSG